MSLGDILNTDLDVVSLRLREGFAWWLDELAVMAAPAFSKSRRRVKTTAERCKDGTYLIRSADHPDRLHTPGGSKVLAALVLPDPVVLTRTLASPPMPERDIRRMLTLDLDRLTPFRADAAYHDIRVAPAADAGGKRQVRLGVVSRAHADAALAEAQAAGIRPAAVIALREDAEAFDFLPAMRASGAAETPGAASKYLWTAVGLLLALNIGLAIWRDVEDLSRLQAEVASQQPLVERIRLLRREADEQPALARAAARAAGEPLRVLNALSEALPRDAWVQRLAWDGASVRVVGLRRNDTDVIGALRREPLFVNVRDADASSTASAEGFDILADVSPSAARARR